MFCSGLHQWLKFFKSHYRNKQNNNLTQQNKYQEKYNEVINLLEKIKFKKYYSLKKFSELLNED